MFWRRPNPPSSQSADQIRLANVERLLNQLALGLDAHNSSHTTTTSSSQLSSEAFQAYLVEYEQCMASYRHTYATIWQAGSIFAAISAAIIAISSVVATRNSASVPPLIQVLAPIPVLFWYHGIYRPMNRYGELRNDRLVQLEQLLNDNIAGLQMNHFRSFSHFRKGEPRLKRILKFKWLWKPRVHEIITIFGVILTLIEVYLVWIYYLFPLFYILFH